MSPREVGVRLTLEGHKSAGSGAWYASRVHALLASQRTLADSCGKHDLSKTLWNDEVGRPGPRPQAHSPSGLDCDGTKFLDGRFSLPTRKP